MFPLSFDSEFLIWLVSYFETSWWTCGEYWCLPYCNWSIIEDLKSMLELSCHSFLKLMGQSQSLNLTSGIDRWFLDGMSIGLQTRYMMGTWLCSKGKRRYSCQSQRRVVLMSTRSIPRLHLHPHKLIALSWHLGIGWGDMAIANLSGLASLTNNHCLQQSYPNVRYRSDSVDGDPCCN